LLDTNTVNKRTNLPRMNSCAQSIPNLRAYNTILTPCM
jgi:hypothetical protein